MTLRAPFLVLSLLASLSTAAQLPRNEVSVAAGWVEFADIGGSRAIGASYGRLVAPALVARAGVISAVASDHSFIGFHAMAELHPIREGRLSPWIGLGVAHLSIQKPDHSTIAPIGGAGLDVALSPRFALGAQFHYAPFEINPNDRFPLRVNPATVTLAARWRY